MPTASKHIKPYWFQEATLEAREAGKRYIAMLGGSGGGKTYWGPIWLAQLIAHDVSNGNGKDARYIVLGRTYRMTKDTLIPTLMNHYEGTNLEGRYHRSDQVYELPTGGLIYFRSADQPYRIEGIHARGAWVDEPSEMPAMVWIILQSRVGLYEAPVLFTGYPTNLGWYYTSIYQAWKNGDPDYECIQFASTDNPEYPEKEMARAERTMPGWLYDMRYHGQFRKPSGLVYPDFTDSIFCEPFDIPDDWPSYTVIDPGLFYAGLHTAWHEGIYYSYAEYYEKNPASAKEHAAGLQGPMSGSLMFWLYDPARATDMLNLVAEGCGPFYKANNAVDAGIETVTGVIKEGRWKVMRGRCPVLVDQMGKYRRPTDPATGEVTSVKPIKMNDDLPDCARYHFHTLEGGQEELPNDEVLVYDDIQEISKY